MLLPTFSCRGRGHYASECPHCTLAIEHESHEPFELDKEFVDPEGRFEDLVDIENNLLHDVHLGVVRCMLINPVMSDEWKHTTIFYTLVKCRKTLMKIAIDGSSTMKVVAESVIKAMSP